MAYSLHDFKDGDVIYASDINELDAQILANIKAISALKKFVGYTGGTEITEDVPFTTMQGYLGKNGTYIDSGNTGWHVTDFVDITSYEKLKISGSMGWGNLIYAFYTSDKVFVSGGFAEAGGTYTSFTEQDVDIPSGVLYLRVCQSDQYQHIAIKGIYTKDE